VGDTQLKAEKWLTRNVPESGDFKRFREGLSKGKEEGLGNRLGNPGQNAKEQNLYQETRTQKDNPAVNQQREPVTDFKLNKTKERREASEPASYRDSVPQSSSRRLESSNSYSKDSTFKRNAARFFSDSRYPTPQTNARDFARNAEIFYRNTPAVNFRDSSAARPIPEKPIQPKPQVATNSDQFIKNAKLFYGYESSCASAANSIPPSSHSVTSVHSYGSMNTEFRANLSKFYDGKPSTQDALKLNAAAFYANPTPVEPLNMKISQPARVSKSPLNLGSSEYQKNHAKFFGVTPPQSSGQPNALKFSAKKIFDS
jgi:hypothetical protein